MMHLLAIIADLYTPLLIFIWLFYLYQEGATRGAEIKVLLLSLLLVYTVMFLDNYFNIWATWELDYSTHSGLALIFVVNLTWRNKILRLFAPLSLLVYCCLMLKLNYHSFADILTTLLVLLPALLYWQKGLKN
ncbi:conserved hypothetical protein [Psychromonas ingrahamii 37]|uniref:Phosphatase PAP2 family protein n=1 Tax=Psychromonas ingrahamii (strain DSM 17664 / CCUG 51855 / 37) TaxID=357804 RepID=A1ST63_PSYIN|nr:hypothetical protein [Psychromonas ingrahamii]ABM02678.1 conserved hypothetical protein [Psychromonas ingrahamii 37]